MKPKPYEDKPAGRDQPLRYAVAVLALAFALDTCVIQPAPASMLHGVYDPIIKCLGEECR